MCRAEQSIPWPGLHRCPVQAPCNEHSFWLLFYNSQEAMPKLSCDLRIISYNFFWRQNFVCTLWDLKFVILNQDTNREFSSWIKTEPNQLPALSRTTKFSHGCANSVKTSFNKDDVQTPCAKTSICKKKERKTLMSFTHSFNKRSGLRIYFPGFPDSSQKS